jgi:hypothetical protein
LRIPGFLGTPVKFSAFRIGLPPEASRLDRAKAAPSM